MSCLSSIWSILYGILANYEQCRQYLRLVFIQTSDEQANGASVQLIVILGYCHITYMSGSIYCNKHLSCFWIFPHFLSCYKIKLPLGCCWQLSLRRTEQGRCWIVLGKEKEMQNKLVSSVLSLLSVFLQSYAL